MPFVSGDRVKIIHGGYVGQKATFHCYVKKQQAEEDGMNYIPGTCYIKVDDNQHNHGRRSSQNNMQFFCHEEKNLELLEE